MSGSRMRSDATVSSKAGVAAAFVVGFGCMRAWALTYLTNAGVTPPVSLGLLDPLFIAFAPALLGMLMLLMLLCPKIPAVAISFPALVAGAVLTGQAR